MYLLRLSHSRTRVLPLLSVLGCSAVADDTLNTPLPGEWLMFKRQLDHRGTALDMSGEINENNVCVAWERPVSGPQTRAAGGAVIAAVDGAMAVFVAVDGACEDDGTGCISGTSDDVPGKLWALNGAGEVLWSVRQDDPVAQFDPYAPMIADLDADGEREIVVPALNKPYLFAFAAEGENHGLLEWMTELPEGRRSEGAPAAVNLDPSDAELEILLGDDADNAGAGERAAFYAISGSGNGIEATFRIPSRVESDDLCVGGAKFDSSQPVALQTDGAWTVWSGSWNGNVYAMEWGEQGLQQKWFHSLPLIESLPCSVPKVRSSASVADLDGDGTMELVFGWMHQEGQDGDLASREEEATLQVLDAETGDSESYITVGDWKSSPSIADLNPNEPGLEIAGGRVGGFYSAKSNLDFDWESGPHGSDRIGQRSSPAITDIDGDGDLDVIVGAEGDEPGEDNGLVAFDGATGEEIWRVSFGDDGGLYKGASSSPALGDIDGDGALEVVILGADGVLRAIDSRCD